MKRAYQYLIWWKYKEDHKSRSVCRIVPIDSGIIDESFFGYFDKSPSSSTGQVLCHLTSHSTRLKPSPDVPIQVAVFDPALGSEPILKLETSSYNWQQGSRAHWLNDDLFIFNDFSRSRAEYIARVASSTSRGEVARFSCPVQDSFGTKYFLSVNYKRLMALNPDYGYRNLPPSTEIQLRDHDKDGIWRVDYRTGAVDLILSLAAITEIGFKKEYASAVHEVNHISISPNGERFIFVHRYYLGRRRYGRLLLASSDGSGLAVLADFGMVSHCYWADDDTILSYLCGPGNRNAYHLIDVETGESRHFANGVLDRYGDGHPHVHGDWFVTDTYPDRARMQHLLLGNWKTGEVDVLGRFFHGFSFHGETRCDLHPRFSANGTTVFVDSVFGGNRTLYELHLPQ